MKYAVLIWVCSAKGAFAASFAPDAPLMFRLDDLTKGSFLDILSAHLNSYHDVPGPSALDPGTILAHGALLLLYAMVIAKAMPRRRRRNSQPVYAASAAVAMSRIR